MNDDNWNDTLRRMTADADDVGPIVPDTDEPRPLAVLAQRYADRQDTTGRIAALETENARLRSRIVELERVNADLAEKARRLLGIALGSAPDQDHRP